MLVSIFCEGLKVRVNQKYYIPNESVNEVEFWNLMTSDFLIIFAAILS